jgi:nitrogen fixation NifU-like protein
MSAAELYQETIVDHSKAPRNAVIPDDVDAKVRGSNPICGDRVDVGVRMGDGVIVEVAVTARACALCVASGSIMTELVSGRDVSAVRDLAERFEADLDPGADDGADLGELVSFRGIRRFPSRKGCALLPWHTLLDALSVAAENS